MKINRSLKDRIQYEIEFLKARLLEVKEGRRCKNPERLQEIFHVLIEQRRDVLRNMNRQMA